MSFSVAGKTAVVTGAAHGVGSAIAQHLLEQDANVVLADLDKARLDQIVRDRRENAETFHFTANQSPWLNRRNLLAATIQKFERIDILVNASRQFQPSNQSGADAKILDTMIEQNLKQHYELSWMAAERFKEQNRGEDDQSKPIGAIVNISSIAAQRVQPEFVEFSMSCAALNQMTRAMAVAMARDRIRVNAVAFGSAMSNSLKSAIQNQPKRRSQIIEATPLGRIGEASELAEAVQFLASDGARFITGQVLTVDGGRSLLDRAQVPFH